VKLLKRKKRRVGWSKNSGTEATLLPEPDVQSGRADIRRDDKGIIAGQRLILYRKGPFNPQSHSERRGENAWGQRESSF